MVANIHIRDNGSKSTYTIIRAGIENPKKIFLFKMVPSWDLSVAEGHKLSKRPSDRKIFKKLTKMWIGQTCSDRKTLHYIHLNLHAYNYKWHNYQQIHSF